MMTEKEYVGAVGLEHRKRFAQFFTPEAIGLNPKFRCMIFCINC